MGRGEGGERIKEQGLNRGKGKYITCEKKKDDTERIENEVKTGSEREKMRRGFITRGHKTPEGKRIPTKPGGREAKKCRRSKKKKKEKEQRSPKTRACLAN